MSIYEEILNWSKELPMWQSDALARLWEKKTLTQSDEDDLLALLKAAHGIPDEQNRQPAPLTSEQMPATSQPSSHVVLREIKNMRNVNAIAENQVLSFGEKGLTVIFGDNGSGKSGYSRVLKRACRARNREPILSNVNSKAKGDSATATFEISINSVDESILWADDKNSESGILPLAVFDSHCARSYLNEKGDFSCIPYGLDVFQGLGELCDRLKIRIKDEKDKSVVDLSIFSELKGSTEVGLLIENLSAQTSIDEVNKLAALSEVDLNRNDELDRLLIESDPKEKAHQLCLRAQRMEAVAEQINVHAALVTSTEIERLQELTNRYIIAKNAADIAAHEFAEAGNFLPKTGGNAWKILYDAAKKFAQESFPDKEFPSKDENARCPLCQQTLVEGAERLRRFEVFIQQDVDKKLSACFDEWKKAFGLLSDASFAPAMDNATYSEISMIDPQLALEVRAYEQALLERKNTIVLAKETFVFTHIGAEPLSPVARLKDCAKRLRDSAKNLEAVADESVRESLKKESKELKARMQFSAISPLVIETINKLVFGKKLEKCLTELKTAPISNKASQVAEKIVTAELNETLLNEFDRLNVNTLKIFPKRSGVKGKPLHGLALDAAQPAVPSDILSEGEQRAIAIASFLAEVGLGGGKNGIVFDDPVSSLDHSRREVVAKRLAEEARDRQVIIFTHDLYFLNILKEMSKESGSKFSDRNLTRASGFFGVVTSNIPFNGMSVKERVKALNKLHQEIEELCESGVSSEEVKEKTKIVYGKLRDTWERAVEDVLFNGVVQRFCKGISTQKLHSVAVETDDYWSIYIGMTKCSNYAHDQASSVGNNVPTLKELKQDIADLENWRQRVETRNKKIQESRKERPML